MQTKKKKKVYEPVGKLVQTRVPGELFDWMESEASKEGISMAAYVRRAIIFFAEPRRQGAK